MYRRCTHHRLPSSIPLAVPAIPVSSPRLVHLLDFCPVEHVPIPVRHGPRSRTATHSAGRLAPLQLPLLPLDELQRAQALRGLAARPLCARTRCFGSDAWSRLGRTNARVLRAWGCGVARAHGAGGGICARRAVSGGEPGVDGRQGVVHGFAGEVTQAGCMGDVRVHETRVEGRRGRGFDVRCRSCGTPELA